jgi:hypothetical protein
MKYALNIDSETNAVLSATYEQFAWEGCVIVDHLPDGDITDYDFIDGEYVLNEERKKAREEQEDVKSTEEIYAEALNMLGVETKEVTNDAE